MVNENYFPELEKKKLQLYEMDGKPAETGYYVYAYMIEVGDWVHRFDKGSRGVNRGFELEEFGRHVNNLNEAIKKKLEIRI